MADIPFSFSQVPGDPSFRSLAVNCVALVPLLSSDKLGEETKTSSVQSYQRLCAALQGQGDLSTDASSSNESKTKEVDILLVVPNSSLTRPGDWKYPDTPLKSFHWQHGSQRLRIFDGRPQNSRLAHDRVMNHSVTRDWIDLCPSRQRVLSSPTCATVQRKPFGSAQEELRRAEPIC
ncbi:hypothetical protein MPSEU_000852200 [Mayamaea pseudoterrestris]|nr:hypothetical protein MPSEU_000852200 [Mayamaea pseudoterrestris]